MNKINLIKREKEKRNYCPKFENSKALSLYRFDHSLSKKGDGRILCVMRSGEILILTTLYIELSNVRMGNLLIQNKQVPFQVTRQCLPFTKMASKKPPNPSPSFC